MSQITFSCLHFLAPDAKALEAELNRRARSGWALVWLHLGVARFERTERSDLSYCVELRPTPRVEERDEAYLQLCDDAGWKLQATTKTFYVFASKPGTHPTPLQTDPALDFELHWSTVLRQAQRGALSPLLVMLLLCLFFFSRVHLWQAFLSMWSLLSGLCLLLLAAGNLVYGLWLSRFRQRYRHYAQSDQSIPTPKVPAARLRGLGALLTPILILPSLLLPFINTGYSQTSTAENTRRMASLPVVRAVDLGATEVSGSNYLMVEGSPFLFHVDGLTFDSGGMVRSEFYRCRWPWLAEQVVTSLLADEAQEDHPHLHPPIVLSPVQLGFDQAWLYQRENGWQSLLVREGNVVALVEGYADFTDPEILGLVRTRLRLEE